MIYISTLFDSQYLHNYLSHTLSLTVLHTRYAAGGYPGPIGRRFKITVLILFFPCPSNAGGDKAAYFATIFPGRNIWNGITDIMIVKVKAIFRAAKCCPRYVGGTQCLSKDGNEDEDEGK